MQAEERRVRLEVERLRAEPCQADGSSQATVAVEDHERALNLGGSGQAILRARGAMRRSLAKAPSVLQRVAPDGIAGQATRRIRRGEALFNAGDGFTAFYTVRVGFFKSCMVDAEGREQVTGFFMVDDLLGLDGAAAGRHVVSVLALEDSEVLIMPFAAFEEASRDNVSLQHALNAALAGQIVHDQSHMIVLGAMAARERVAAFLIGLSRRFVARGYSASDFHLRMTRREIASYLGLKLETVSRLFSLFAQEALIEVDGRHLRIVDAAGLERLVKDPT